jgi:hypothetical protein
MKKKISHNASWLTPLFVAGLFISSTYLPKTWSQNPSGQGVWAGPLGSPSGNGVVVAGPSHCAGNQTHLMSSANLSNGFQQIVLVDPARQTMAVYHIDPDKGDIQLKSVRKIDADFALEEFNLGEPSPSTIRKNLRISDR